MSMKRPSSASAAARAKKIRVEKDVKEVVGAITNSEALAEDLRAVLKKGLPVVLAANKADRHRFEDEIVQQAERALVAVQSSLEESSKKAAAERDVVIAREERQKRKAAKKAAEEAREQLKAAQGQRAMEKDFQEGAVQAAKKALKDASKDAAKADADMQRLAEKKERLSAALADLDGLKEGTAPADKKSLKNFVSLAKEHSFDLTMSSSFAIAAKKAAAQRSEFEAALFTNFKAAMSGQVESIAKQLAEGEPAKAEKHAAEEAAKAALDAAQTTLATGKDELAKAEEAYKNSGKDLQKATAHLNSVWADMKEVCDAADDVNDEIKDFKESVLVKFEALKNLEPEPEPVEEVAAGLPPWWILKGVTPAGPEKDMGGWTAIQFTTEQQERYGCDADGNVTDPAKHDAAFEVAPADVE